MLYITKLQLAKMRQEVRRLRGRRGALERVAMSHVPMVAASLVSRRFRPGGPVYYSLSIPTAHNSWHYYVRKGELEVWRRRAEAWRECVGAMAEWVQVNKRIEKNLRRIAKGRCVSIEIRRGKRR